MWKWKACYRKAFSEGKSADEFMAMLPQLDAEFKARVEAAKAEGKVLRYVAKLKMATAKYQSSLWIKIIHCIR